MDRPQDTDKIEPDPIKVKFLETISGKIKEAKYDPREIEERIMKWLYG